MASKDKDHWTQEKRRILVHQCNLAFLNKLSHRLINKAVCGTAPIEINNDPALHIGEMEEVEGERRSRPMQ